MSTLRRQTIGIVGAGRMGAGIAQVAAEHGHYVLLQDVAAGAIQAGLDRIRDGLERRAAKLDLDLASRELWVDGRLARVVGVGTVEHTAVADVVIEAVLEDLTLKQSLFAELDRLAQPSTILATNTSALSITRIAHATRHPERVVGLHFFNPAPVMQLVEVVAGAASDPLYLDQVEALVHGWQKVPVRSADAPGFIVNRVNRPFTIEALRILERGDASVEAIDEAMRAAHYPLGPFELMDLAGVDVNLAAARGVWLGLGLPDRLRPSGIQRQLVKDGRLGRKAGRGFYRYHSSGTQAVDPQFAARSGATLDGDAIRDRIISAIEAEAVYARDELVASEDDIDLALRLGANHPFGPFERMRARVKAC